ncbi:MAG: BatA domain-containing protein [Victivallales bacterium]|nr:BatA domain-containing protein [Victivallales bacterium]
MLVFAHPNLLWALGLLAIPILLHLLNRRRPDALIFPTIRFLQHAQLPQKGHKHLQDALLLLLRLLAFAAMLLLLAGPRWQRPPQKQTTQSRRRAIFLLDCSASMNGWNHRNNALQLLEQSLHSLDSSWETAAIAFAANAITASEPSYNSHDTLSFLQKAPQTCTTARPAEAISHALALLDGASDARLYIASDFQRSDWLGITRVIPETIFLHLLPCSKPPEQNLGIAAARATPLPGNRLRTIIAIRNYGNQEAHTTLTVTIGSQIQTAPLTIPPLSQMRTSFAFQDAPELHFAHAQIQPDDFPLDNSFPFALRTSQLPKALILQNSFSDEALAAADFTSAAMARPKNAIADGFNVESTTTDLLPKSLQEFHVFFLLGTIHELPQDALAQIAKRVAEGATLFVTPGNQAALSLKRLQEQNLLEAHAAGLAVAQRHTPFGVGEILPSSSLATLFPSNADLFLFPIFRYVRLTPVPPTQTILTSLDHSPLLLEKPHGRGKVFFFAFDFSLDFSALPLTTSFLPLLRELSHTSVPEDFGVKRLLCGTPLLDAQNNPVDTKSPRAFLLDGWPVEVTPPPSESTTEHLPTEDLHVALTGQTATSSSALPPQRDIPLAKPLAVIALLAVLAALFLRSR